jgi:hypothetical protein
MARLSPRLAAVLLAALALLLPAQAMAQPTGIPADIPEPDALNAFKQYWNAFEQYEAQLLQQGRKNFSRSWEELKTNYNKQKAKLDAQQLARLQKAASNYREHLQEHPDAENRPYVLLNLAQINFLIGSHLGASDESAGSFAKSEALAQLKEIEQRFTGFPYREQAFYLRAVVLDSMSRPDEALAAWQALAAIARNSIHGVYARIAVGDHYFSRDLASEALPAYKKAVELLGTIEVEDLEYERLRANYRLAWAAYRAAELDTAIKASLVLLRPGTSLRSEADREKIQQDAVDLVGDALYETNAAGRTREILRSRELDVFAAKIGLRTVSRYHANGIHNEAASLGEDLARDFPLAAEAPEIMRLTADSLAKLGQDSRRVSMLEKLAMMLPSQGLWRSRHRDEQSVVREMESKARQAAIAAAAWHYERGLASGSLPSFAAAAAHYEMLIEHGPNTDDASQHRLRLAHCHFFSGQNEEAARLYEAIKTEFKVDPETLQVASYQLVLANERRWRETYARNMEKGAEPGRDEATSAALKQLEKSVDEFAARFPSQSRSIDLLLVAANANRDMEGYDRAASYWQRALVSQPSPAQRAVAVRGLVFASLKNGSPGDVVELVRRFLKLEDWQALGLNVGTELKGVLSAAALDEGKRLNDSGKVLEAGALLAAIASEFPDIPDRDRIWRDGGYLIAIGGDWAAAQKTAEDYLDSGLAKSRADMVYLAARSHEYQIRLREAAQRYFELGTKHPTHSRATASLGRAEKLALAESDRKLAAAAALALALAERDKDPKTSQESYARAATHLEEAEDPKGALAIAQKRLRAAKSPTDRFKAEVMLTRLTYAAGREQEALDNMTILARRVERDKTRLNAEDYAQVAGEIHYLLGEEARRRFEDFRLVERSGSLNDNVRQKSRYFEDLVASYDKAAASGHPRWSTEARYRLAVAAESFAEEIAGVPTREGETLTFKTQSRYKATVDRLKGLAKRYYSSNALAARKDVARYKDNEWVKKSMMRLTGEKSELPETKHQEQMPTALPDTMPSQWSL